MVPSNTKNLLPGSQGQMGVTATPQSAPQTLNGGPFMAQAATPASPLMVNGRPLQKYQGNATPAGNTPTSLATKYLDSTNIHPIDVQTQGLGLERYQQFADEAYKSQTRHLDPQFQSEEARFRQQMVNQGLQEGTTAYNNALANFDRRRNDAYGQARTLADQTAMQMQNQAFGQNFSESQLANALALGGLQSDTSLGVARIGADASKYGADAQRQVGMGRNANDLTLGLGNLALANRDSDQSFLLGLGGLGLDAFNANQGAQGRNFNETMSWLGMLPGTTPTQIDAYGPHQDNYAGRMDAYNQQQQRRQQNSQLLASAAIAAGMMMCDRNAKDYVGEIAPDTMLEAVIRLPVDRWSYKHDGSVHVGTYSQDFHRELGLPERATIEVVDMLGATIGSIQALAKRVEALAKRVEALEA